MNVARRISLILLVVFYSLFLLQLPDFLDKINWMHATATITYIMSPDGEVYGNFTDLNEKEYTNVALYIDYSLSGHNKNGEQHIGDEVEIIYAYYYSKSYERGNNGIMYGNGSRLPRIAHYPNCFKGFIITSIALGISFALFITSSILLKRKDKRGQPDKHAGQSNDPTE